VDGDNSGPAGQRVAVPALAEYVFLIPARETLVVLTPFAPSATKGMDPFLKVLTFLLYGFAPLVVLLSSLGKSVFRRREHKTDVRPSKARGKDKYAAAPRKRLSPALLGKLALSALPIVLMALGLYVSHKELRKPYVLSNYYSRQKRLGQDIEPVTSAQRQDNPTHP
jgi:hypothetical protein